MTPTQPMFRSRGRWYRWVGDDDWRIWHWWNPADWPVRIRHAIWQRRNF